MNAFENIKVMFQSILDAINEALIIIEQTGQILLINQSAKNIFGFDETILFFQDYLLPECWQAINNILKSKTETATDVSIDSFNMQLSSEDNLSVNLTVKENVIEGKQIYLIKIIPFRATIPSDSLKNISILSPNIKANIFDKRYPQCH